MTNKEYLQYEPMLIKISNKFRNNSYGLDIEDIKQIGCFGMMRAFDKYKEGTGMAFKTYIYNCIRWSILKEMTELKRVKEQYSISSLDSEINEETGCMHDILPDLNVNIEAEALEDITIDEYIKEFNLILPPVKSDIFIDKYVNNLKSKDIESKYKKTPGSLNTILRQCRSELVRKSHRIRLEYEKHINMQSKNLNIYKNPSQVEDKQGYYDSRLRFIDKMNNRQIKEDAELLNYYRGTYEKR